MKKILFLSICLLGCFSCTKENPVLDLKITPSTLSANSKEEIVFTIEGSSEFLVFYSGLEGKKFEDYPSAANSGTVNMLAASPSFSYAYDYHGSAKAVFVASSYGNWGEDSEEKIFEFDFQITDTDTGLRSVILKTSGLGGTEFEAVIDAANGIVNVAIPSGTNLSKLTTNIISSSIRAKVLLNDMPFSNLSSVDFSSGSRDFIVEAISGDRQTWKIMIEQ